MSHKYDPLSLNRPLVSVQVMKAQNKKIREKRLLEIPFILYVLIMSRTRFRVNPHSIVVTTQLIYLASLAKWFNVQVVVDSSPVAVTASINDKKNIF